jgi:hypothetical protein
MYIVTAINLISRKSTYIISYTHCVNKSILRSENNNVDRFSKEALNSLVEKITISVDPGIAQSVQRLATGWTAEGSKFESC